MRFEEYIDVTIPGNLTRDDAQTILEGLGIRVVMCAWVDGRPRLRLMENPEATDLPQARFRLWLSEQVQAEILERHGLGPAQSAGGNA